MTDDGRSVRMVDPDWLARVLAYWYVDLQPAAWFTRSDVVDAKLRERFSGLLADLRTVDPAVLARTARGALAAVLVLDQFPRNIHRGSPEAFASDAQALAVARAAIGLGLDRLLRRDQRLFLYLPFEHSEDRLDQARSVELMTRLGDPGWTSYAHAHKAIIDRFGRFPHRNNVLGRASTTEEVAFLATPGSGF